MDVRVRLSNNVLKTTLVKDVAELEKVIITIQELIAADVGIPF